MKEYLKRQLKRLAMWAWLRLLFYVLPRYWPGYLKSDLHPVLQTCVQTLRSRVLQFEADHWRELSARAQGAGCWSAPVRDADALVASTVFEITAWRNSYKVFARVPDLEPWPTPSNDRGCFDYKVLIPAIDDVYKAVQKARDDQARRDREAAEEKKLEAQRQAWVAAEASRHKSEQTAATDRLKSLLLEMKSYDARSRAAMDTARACANAINALDSEACQINDKIAAFASSAAPVMDAVQKTEANLEGVLGTVLAGGPGEDLTSASTQAASLHDFQSTYTAHYASLSQIRARMDDLRARRAHCRKERAEKVNEIEEHRKTIQQGCESLKSCLKLLRDLINSVQDDSGPRKEWERLEAQVRQGANNFSKMSALARRQPCWHLEKFSESKEKQQLVSKAEAICDRARTEQDSASDFEKTFAVSTPAIDYHL